MSQVYTIPGHINSGSYFKPVLSETSITSTNSVSHLSINKPATVTSNTTKNTSTGATVDAGYSKFTRTTNRAQTNTTVDVIDNATVSVATSNTLTYPFKNHDDHPEHYIRCLTPLFEEYENNPESRSTLGPILGVNSLEELHQKNNSVAEIANYEEYYSESDRFLIKYSTTGGNAVPDTDADENGVPDYVENAAVYADSSWNYLVGELGFRDPVPDLENPLIILIDSLSRGIYGDYRNSIRTIRVQNTYSEDDFPENFDPDGHELGALKVTIAHEFKHAIQYVTNISVSLGWLELDATMAEEVVFPTVKDYLNYLTSNQNPSVFLNPQRSIPFLYYHVTAGLFYREKFGDDFWVKVWERLGSGEANGTSDYVHKAISLELTSRGHSPDMEFVNMYLWHYAAGTNSTVDFGFKDRLLYPDIRLSNTDINRFFPFKSPNITFNWKAAYVYEFYPDTDSNPDENLMVGLFRSLKFQNFDGRIHVGLIAYFKNGSIETTTIDLSEDTELISFYGSPYGFIGSQVDWNLNDIQKIGVVLANSTPQRQGTAQSPLPWAQLVIGTSSNPSTNKYGEFISDALEEAQAEALLDRLVGKSDAPSINSPIDFISADVSGNESISAFDASLILQKNDSLISAYPVDTDKQKFAPLPSWYTHTTAPSVTSVLSGNQCGGDCIASTDVADTPEVTMTAFFGNPENAMDDILRVQISVSSDLSFHSGFIEVKFPDSLLEFIEHEISSLYQNTVFFRHTILNDQLKFAFASSGITYDSESVLTLRFRPIKTETMDVKLTLNKLELDEQVSLEPDLSISQKVKRNDGVSIERPSEIPITTELHPVYPNPFNPTTTIPFSIATRQNVSIQIFDLTGRLHSTLSNEIFAPGSHSVRFNAVNLSSGIYIARMVVSDPSGFNPTEIFIQRLTLIK